MLSRASDSDAQSLVNSCWLTQILTAQEIILIIVSFSKDSAFLDAAVREREEELSRRTLAALLDMRIKFPGKTDEEAEMILESVSCS